MLCRFRQKSLKCIPEARNFFENKRKLKSKKIAIDIFIQKGY